MKNRIWSSATHRFFLAAFVVMGWLPTVADPPLLPGDQPQPTAISRVAGAGDASKFAHADHIIVYDEAINKMKDTGVTYVDQTVILKVLTEHGCTTQSVLRWNFDPQSSHVDVREVNLIRDGKAIPVDVSQVIELPAPQAAIYWSDRIKVLQLPRLQVNDGIEIKTFRKGYTYALLEEPPDDRYIPPMRGEYFDIVLFQAEVPIVEKKYVMIMPRQREETGRDRRLHATVYNGPLYSSIRYDDQSIHYAWWAHDMKPYPHEDRQPDASDFATKVVMSTAQDWQAKSSWFFQVNEQQFKVTPEIQAKVDEILADAGLNQASSEEARARILVHWVAQNIRYSGQTMGEGEGFTLHPGAMIFEQRSGVCKDIAGMLITMMRAAGLDSYGAMTMAGSRIEDLPADQFNHCVTALKKADGTFEMYDPTWVPYNNDIWSRLETEQQYLIGTPDGRTLATIPYSPPEKSRLLVTHDAQLLKDGTLEGTFFFQGMGASDSRLRRMATRTPKSEYRAALMNLLANISDRVEDVRFEHLPLTDVFQDMWLKVHYRVPQFAFPVDGGFEFSSPMLAVTSNHPYLFSAAATHWEETRETDILLWYTQLVDGTETIKLPKGFSVVKAPEAVERDATFAAFKFWNEPDKNQLTIRQLGMVKRRQIPPAYFQEFKEVIDEVHDCGEMLFRVEQGGKR